MAIRWIPVPCRCEKHAAEHHNAHDGKVHRDNEPCPLASQDFLHPKGGTCCSFEGRAAGKVLLLLRELELCAGLCESYKSAEDALDFAAKLRAVAEQLDSESPASLTPLTIYSMGDELPDVNVAADIPTEHALYILSAAAKWYQRVGERGYGVAYREK